MLQMATLVLSPGAASMKASPTASYATQIAIGQHFLQAVETGDGTNANTFNSSSLANLTASIWN
jgi:hypothetical protein